MKILALELSTARGGLAWLDHDAELAREWPNERKNSGALFENLDAVTKKFGAPETIIVGLQPEVAFAMVQLGLTLEGVTTALDLEEGLAYLEEKTRAQP